jgi:hypothetical protein
MIQRIQTVYLLGASVLMALLLLIPLGAVAIPGSAGIEQVTVSNFPGMTIGTGILIAGLFIAVFLFQNRARQIGAIQILMVLSVAFMVWLALVLFPYKDGLAEGEVFAFRLGAVLPFLSLVLQFMALSKVRRDHRLVRSMDRLR